jgi:hydroxyacylglutathione hydrolase
MFQCFFDAGLRRASYLVACPRTRDAVIVDPRRDADAYVEAARAHGLRLAWVFQTHLHGDFACGARELVALGAKAIAGPGANLRYLHHGVTHGERLRMGDVSVQFFHTPGHTPEHISILTSQPDQPVRLFTGDTLLAGEVGRPEAGDEPQQRRLAGDLHDSLFTRILALDDRIQVHPGRPARAATGGGAPPDLASTIGRERRTNPMLRHDTREAFVAAVLNGLPDVPPYMAWLRTVNQAGPPRLALVNGYRGLPAISPGSAASALRAGGRLLDMRAPGEFRRGHARGALNIVFGERVGACARARLAADPRIVLLAADRSQAMDAARQLLRIGVSRIDGYINGGYAAWKAAGLPTAEARVGALR